MPYISITTNTHLTTNQHVQIKSTAARIMQEHAGKAEEWLMVAMHPAALIFFQGSSDARLAYVEIRYVGAFPPDVKERISKAFATLLHDTIGVPADKLYVQFVGSNASDWAWSGALLGS